jgi:hypothetical protein
MQDLNDLYIFCHVVEHNGFTGAARALGVARSSICQIRRHTGQGQGGNVRFWTSREPFTKQRLTG